MRSRVVRLLRADPFHLPYRVGLQLQQFLVDYHHKHLNEHPNTLVLLEHEPVYTVGIRNKGYTKEDENKLKSLGADFCRTNRGGLVTFHGPGQLVAYPVLNLKQFRPSMKWYVQEMERMVIRICAELGIKAKTSPDTGVWVDDRKICAIGVHGSRYITTHGLALNCNVDLKWFDHIVPCGIEGKGVTSISKEMNLKVKVSDISPIFTNAFSDQFECDLIEFPFGEASQLLRNARRSMNIEEA